MHRSVAPDKIRAPPRERKNDILYAPIERNLNRKVQITEASALNLRRYPRSPTIMSSSRAYPECFHFAEHRRCLIRKHLPAAASMIHSGCKSALGGLGTGNRELAWNALTRLVWAVILAFHVNFVSSKGCWIFVFASKEEKGIERYCF